MRKAKIVGTLGPASANESTLAAMLQAGLDVVRLNFSHGEPQDHRRMFELVHKVSRDQNKPVAVMADLCGPKIRVGRLQGGAAAVLTGASFTFTTDELVGDNTRVSTSYAALPGDVRPGERILVDDGLLEFEVLEVAGREVRCVTKVGGLLKDHKGMNLPGAKLSTPALTPKDREDLAFARELGVDYFALSFVRRPADVAEAKALAGDIPVIAKIEKPEAVNELAGIIQVADGLMVARGDLGVEAGPEKVPLIQKRMIREAAVRGLPVITATQMLDSMIANPRPTRAEVSDVANAVLDGTDAVMLSGETAAGKYPVEAVRTMAAVIGEVEQSEIFDRLPEPVKVSEHTFSNAIARAAVKAAADLNLKALAVYTETGHSASLVSACRPNAAIIAFSRHDAVLRRLSLRWGVRPLHGDWVLGVSGVVEQAERELLAYGLVRPGDEIGVTFGMQDSNGPGRTDVLKLWTVRAPGGPGKGDRP
jgi:pyruvate kinase